MNLEVKTEAETQVSRNLWGRLGGHWVAVGLFIALVYYGVARLGLLLAFQHTNASPVWAASGLALVAVLWRGRRMVPFIALGAFAANYVAFVTYGVPQTRAACIALAIALGNALEALLGAHWLGSAENADELLSHPRGVFRFAALAGGVAAAVAATVATISLCVGGLAAWPQFGYVWSTWWMGDAAGVLLIAPLLLTWFPRRHRTWRRTLHLPAQHRVEALCLLLSVLTVGAVVFGGVAGLGTAYPLAYLVTPPLIWAVFRFRRRGATLALLLTTGLAVWGTTRGHGPFWVEDDVHQSLLLLQTFMGVLTMTVLLSASAIAERAQVRQSLQRARDELELRVQERTAALRDSNLRLEASYAELQTVQELREGLMHMVVHDLRTPLNALDYMLHLLSGQKLNSSAEQAVQLSLQSSRTISGLINNLLDLHLEEAGALRLRREELQAHEVVEAGVAQVAWLAAYKKVELSCEVAPGLPPIQGDADKLTRTVVNLLDNALRYTPAGGSIVVTARGHHDGNALLFSVRDTGTGIAPEAQERIFEKFGRAAEEDAAARASTGLGLTFCKMIVGAHGGQIGVQSAVNHGSTFWFTLPAKVTS